MNWQPISTVPKDGTRVILGRFVKNCAHGHDGRIRVDWWHSARRGDEYEGFGHFNKLDKAIAKALQPNWSLTQNDHAHNKHIGGRTFKAR